MTKPISSRGANLSPAVGTRLTDEGIVVAHDVTRYGLHRMAVEVDGKYPDLVKWLGMLPKGARLMTHFCDERITFDYFTGRLWMFWKEG